FSRFLLVFQMAERFYSQKKKKISPVSLICERENIRERDKVSYLSEVIFGPQCDQTTRSVDLLAT
ncbi:hypothetical protein ED986_21345, partial [Salmonella enterica]|nr:hypothetical protein [Salmonella enterica]